MGLTHVHVYVIPDVPFLQADDSDTSDNGHATDFHFVHIGSMATRGWQGIMIEATAVLPEGRISPRDAVSA